MSVIKEMILFGAGLVITVSLAFIGFNIYGKAAEIGKEITEREESTLNELREYDIMRFDGCVIDGSRAISYIRRIYAKEDIPIEVVKDGRSFTVDGDSVSEIRNTASGYYLNPLKEYYVKVSIDENDAVGRITIEQRR